MEDSSGNRELYPHFVRRDEARFGVSEDKKLELRLGPPGEEWVDQETSKKDSKHRDESILSLGCFSPKPYIITNNHNSGSSNGVSAGAKRGFLDTVEDLKGYQTRMGNQIFSSTERKVGITFSSPWSSTPSSSRSAFQTETQPQQQQSKPQFHHFPCVPQKLPIISEESPLTTCSTKVTELQNPEKQACSPACASVPANTDVLNSSKKRTPAPVVGWPPIRSFRKNIASSSSSKPAASEIHLPPPADVKVEKPEALRKGLFVKINMDGVPIGRKVDLNAYNSYEKLCSAVDELFRCLLAAQGDSSATGDQNKAEPKPITGLLDGKGEYTLVYEDNEGDRMLVGDVPWQMFASSVKRLRVMKTLDLPKFHMASCNTKPENRVG